MSFNKRSFRLMFGEKLNGLYGEGRFKKTGNNIITQRGIEWTFNIPTIQPSVTYAEAKEKEMRMY